MQHLPPSETVRALEASAIDFAVSALIKHSKSVHSLELGKDRMVCVMRKDHPAAKANRLTTRAFLALRHLRIVQSAGDMRFVEEALFRKRACSGKSWRRRRTGSPPPISSRPPTW